MGFDPVRHSFRPDPGRARVWVTPMFLAPSHIGRHEGRRRLSLQEMLIVIAVFAVLAVIFLFSSGHVITKTRTSRVKQDEKALSIALNGYLGEYSDYPSSEEGLVRLLRTPFLSQLPKDPFSRGGQEQYHYYRFKSRETGRPYYVIVSPGPDGDLDFDPRQSASVMYDSVGSDRQSAATISSWDALSIELNLKFYDPTNGINSDGDIIEFE